MIELAGRSPQVLAFVTYETPYFPCAGIAAVMRQLPYRVRSAADLPTIVISPYHISANSRNRIPQLPLENVGNVPVDEHMLINIKKFTEQDVHWYFLEMSNSTVQPPFFNGNRHPYDCLTSDVLLRDSLIFGRAVVGALPAIGADMALSGPIEWRLSLQDWEGATTALAFDAENLGRVGRGEPPIDGKLFLTLHNSYDSHVSREETGTVLYRALSIVEHEVFSVSEQFAAELTEDFLQTEVLATHLQSRLLFEDGRTSGSRVLGIDNGPFRDLMIPSEHVQRGDYGDFGALARWKAEQRQIVLNELEKLEKGPPPEGVEIWGDPAAFRKNGRPWIIMAGRDDPRQKGYDVAVGAARLYLSMHKDDERHAQFLFFPILGDEGDTGLMFLRDLAAEPEFVNDVLAFIGRWEAGFGAAQRAGAYGLMPSLYEPFGMAHEFYLQGSVGIGRATGGNLQQVVPLRATAAFSQAVATRCRRFHAFSATPTGILYREKDNVPTAAKDWENINLGRYMGDDPTGRLRERVKYPVFQDMVGELALAISEAVDIYNNKPELYYRMLCSGIKHVDQVFSWERAAREYLRHLI